MKRKLLILVMVTMVFMSYAQNPFAGYGYDVQVVTLSNGQFDESHDNDRVVEIGSVRFDTKTGKIIGAAENDTVVNVPDPQIVSRFISIDPLAEKYYSISPYAYCANNPIKFVDLKGDSLTLAGTLSDVQSSINVANNAMGGFYTASVDNSGRVSLTSTGQQGTMNSTQQAFFNEMSRIVGDPNMVNVNVVSGNSNTLIGDVSTATIDIGDINQIGNGSYVDAAGTFMHEVSEQYNVQVNGDTPLRAHTRATVTEGRVTGGNVYNPIRPISGPINGTGTVTVPVRNSVGQWHNVTIHYQNGNVTGITR